MSLFGPTITLSSTTSTGIYSAKTILSTSSHLSAISSSVYQRGTEFHSTLSPNIYLSAVSLSSRTNTITLSASSNLVTDTSEHNFQFTNLKMDMSTSLSSIGSSMDLGGTTLSIFAPKTYLTTGTSVSMVSVGLQLSASGKLNLQTASLSAFTSTMTLSASNTRFYVGSSLSFTYASGATYNFFRLGSLTYSTASSSGRYQYWYANSGVYSGFYFDRNAGNYDNDQKRYEFHYLRCHSSQSCYINSNDFSTPMVSWTGGYPYYETTWYRHFFIHPEDITANSNNYLTRVVLKIYGYGSISNHNNGYGGSPRFVLWYMSR